MEHEQTNQSLFDVTYDDNVKQAIKSAAEVAKVAAIAALVSSGLGILVIFMQLSDMYGSSKGGVMLGLIIRGVIVGYLFYYLNKFATQARTGIDGNHPETISAGVASLGSYFKLAGILLIIYVSAMTLKLLIGGTFL